MIQAHQRGHPLVRHQAWSPGTQFGGRFHQIRVSRTGVFLFRKQQKLVTKRFVKVEALDVPCVIIFGNLKKAIWEFPLESCKKFGVVWRSWRAIQASITFGYGKKQKTLDFWPNPFWLQVQPDRFRKKNHTKKDPSYGRPQISHLSAAYPSELQWHLAPLHHAAGSVVRSILSTHLSQKWWANKRLTVVYQYIHIQYMYRCIICHMIYDICI